MELKPISHARYLFSPLLVSLPLQAVLLAIAVVLRIDLFFGLFELVLRAYWTHVGVWLWTSVARVVLPKRLRPRCHMYGAAMLLFAYVTNASLRGDLGFEVLCCLWIWAAMIRVAFFYGARDLAEEARP